MFTPLLVSAIVQAAAVFGGGLGGGPVAVPAPALVAPAAPAEPASSHAIPPPPVRAGDDDAPPASAEGTPPPAADLDPARAALERLERATRDLASFRADLLWSELEEQFESIVTRRGRIAWRVDDAGVRTIGAFIDSRTEGVLGASGARRFPQERDWVLSGRWLVERRHDREPPEFLKRAIAEPGQVHDPFALDEGILPLPIGRSVDSILERFEIAPGTVPGEGPLARLDPQSIEAVVLVPREDAPQAKDIDRVVLYLDRATGLPRGVDVDDTKGTRTWIRLDAVRTGAALEADLLARLTVEAPPEGSGWRVVIE